MSYTINEMTPEGQKLLGEMKATIADFEDLMKLIAIGTALKKFGDFFSDPISELMNFILPGKNDWDALTELVKASAGFGGILKNKLRLYWLEYKTKSGWNSADKAFIEALYNSVIAG